MAIVDTHTENAQGGNKSGGEEEGEKNASANFECNICLDTAKDAVISMCGHLFCWPCLHQWLETRHANQTCPVCKAAISKDQVIPLYGRGSSNQQDPREKLPPRPPGQRTEPEASSQTGFLPGLNLGDGEGFQFHFGIGAFPFGVFTSFNNLGFGGGGGHGLNLPPEMERLEREVPRVLQCVLLLIAAFFYWKLFFS